MLDAIPKPAPFSTKVGIGVMIVKDNNVLLGKRKASHGAGEYAFPGGHLEYMEGFAECAQRETMEECGIEIANVRLLVLYNMRAYAPKHYVHISLLADWVRGEPMVLEPHKCEGWGWYDLQNLPSPLFNTISVSIDAFTSNNILFLDPT